MLLRRDLLFSTIQPILIASVLYNLQYSETYRHVPATLVSLSRGEKKIYCSDLSSAQDSCVFVKEHCTQFDNDGLIPYLRLYFCASSTIQPFVLVLMCIWLLVLFASMATAAGEFLSIHLATIVTILGIPEDLAGVTLFAFGNGSSDLFSTLAAMRSGNGSLAINELFGAAAFITTVVLGLVMVVQPFSVSPASFVGDVVWFIIAAASLTTFVADGQLVLGECLGILGLYAAFISHSLLQARRTHTATISPVEAQAGDSLNENTRLLGTREQQAAEVEDNLSPSVEDESQEVSHLDSSSPTYAELLRDGILRMFPPMQPWKRQSTGQRFLTLFSLPLLIPIGLTTPAIPSSPVQQQLLSSPSAHSGPRISLHTMINYMSSIPLQLYLGPQLVALVITSQLGLPSALLRLVCPCALFFSVGVFSLTIIPSTFTVGQIANAAVGFIVSLCWIYLTATSAVSLLTTLGLILNIPSTILGGTIFAIGNSSNDLVANTAVARRGMPILAAGASFGGPMMNMLLGIGFGSLFQVLGRGAKGREGGRTYKFEVSPGLFVNAGTLLVGLATLLVYAFSKGWKLDRSLGIVLIMIWTAGTAVNVAVSVL